MNSRRLYGNEYNIQEWRFENILRNYVTLCQIFNVFFLALHMRIRDNNLGYSISNFSYIYKHRHYKETRNIKVHRLNVYLLHMVK